MDAAAVKQWLDLLVKSDGITAGWTDPGTNAITPLPKYQDHEHLKALAIDRLVMELVLLASRYTFAQVKKEQVLNHDSIRRMGHLIHKLKAKDTTGRWAYYFVLVMPDKEKEFLDAIEGNGTTDLEEYGKVIASSYGETPTREVRDYLKQTYGFDV